MHTTILKSWFLFLGLTMTKKVDLKTISKERRRLRVQDFNNKVRTELIDREKIKEAKEQIDCFQLRLRKGSKGNGSFI